LVKDEMQKIGDPPGAKRRDVKRRRKNPHLPKKEKRRFFGYPDESFWEKTRKKAAPCISEGGKTIRRGAAQRKGDINFRVWMKKKRSFLYRENEEDVVFEGRRYIGFSQKRHCLPGKGDSWSGSRKMRDSTLIKGKKGKKDNNFLTANRNYFAAAPQVWGQISLTARFPNDGTSGAPGGKTLNPYRAITLRQEAKKKLKGNQPAWTGKRGP